MAITEPLLLLCFSSVIRLPADPNSPAFQVEAIVDPASTAAQKLAPILMVNKWPIL